ncbi:MAG: hypothetical protein LBT03_00050 [Holosporales bacterium]|jgi:hypothetical protein|nr:hypothetical protein [Holosporales bacterium]
MFYRIAGFHFIIFSYLYVKTLNAVNSADEKALLAALKSEAAGHYRCIVSKNASQNKFINGWLKRAYS